MPIKPYLLSQYALLILSITNRFYATSPRRMVELISSLENNSFISHSFRKVRRTVALARVRRTVDSTRCLGYSSSYRWVEDSRQNVRLIVLPSPRLVCSPLPEEFVLVDRISSSLEFARWNSDRPLACLSNATTLQIDDHSQSR